MTKYKYIFWDWNGTLVDDVDACIQCINYSLIKRNITPLTRERYLKIFRFPVIEYYKDAGFDFTKDSFDVLAAEFVEQYDSIRKSLKLFPDVREVLAVYKSKGIKQIILSASEKNELIDTLTHHNIIKYFDDIIACTDHLAYGKLELGKKYAAEKNINEPAVLIGDSFHDYETASSMGIDCIICNRGHANYDDFKSIDLPIVNNLSSTYPLVLYPAGATSYKKPGNLDSTEMRSYDINEAPKNKFIEAYTSFYDDIKNPHKVEDW